MRTENMGLGRADRVLLRRIVRQCHVLPGYHTVVAPLAQLQRLSALGLIMDRPGRPWSLATDSTGRGGDEVIVLVAPTSYGNYLVGREDPLAALVDDAGEEDAG